MRFITDEKYQDLVDKMNYLNTQGELSQKMAMGVALALGKLQKPDCTCDYRDGDDDAEGMPPNSKN